MASDPTKKSLKGNYRKYPPVLTIKQVCEIMKLKPTRVYGMIQRGALQKIEHCGRHIRVLKEGVIDALIAHKNKG